MLNETAGASLPLSRIVVLDLSIARAGPTCVRHLADWGADVIRIEQVGGGSEDIVGGRNGPDYQNLHRNKRTIKLNLKSEEGHAIFMKLAQRADVIVENMRPSVKHRLKIAWDDVKKINPRLVYGSISGFGQDGPGSDRIGLDQIAQGAGGLMSVTGAPGQGPMRVGIAVNDLTAGSTLAFAIMVALFDREHSGAGRWVHTSLIESQVFLLDFQAARYLMLGEVAGQEGNDHPTSIPQTVFATSDTPINIAAPSTRLWEKFCDAIGKPDWRAKAEWKAAVNRSKDRKIIHGEIAEIIKQKPSSHWLEVFAKAGVPCGPILSIDKVFADPQVQHLGMAAPVTLPKYGETHLVASPVNLEGISKRVRNPTPEAGAHTDEVLRWLGYSTEAVGRLREAGVV